MTHLFSIIIPHHDIPQLLQRCLDSIPDTPEVQVIVVDDNSSTEKVDFGHFPGQERRFTECVFDKKAVVPTCTQTWSSNWSRIDLRSEGRGTLKEKGRIVALQHNYI